MQLFFKLSIEVAPVFSQFALHERLLKAVAELKFAEPTPVQQAAIPPALEGRDLRVTAQTGSGKTAAFVLPLLNRLIGEAKPRERIRSLILLPTRELAQQTLREVERFSQFTFIKSGIVTGGEDFKVQAAMLRKLPDVLVSTPGRLIEHLNSGTVDLKEVEVLVLDEADRMLDMGFAEDMQRITAECANRKQTLLFSATTGGAALREVSAKVLNDPLHLRLNGVEQLNESTRQQIITADDIAHKEALARWLLANEDYQKAIVFTNTRAQADRFYGHLVAAGYKAFVLHGDKDQKDRKLAIDRVREGGTKVLVATDVAARGLDIQGMDLVINFDMPRSGDEYVHRVGRTGRAGGEGLAISLICHNDWNLMSSVERYLKQSFERRVIKELKGSYSGPKKVKASGKAAGVKKKKTDKKAGDKKASAKPAAKRKPSGPRRDESKVVSADGLAPLKRKKPAAE
ncbi:ATP-dependent RNA helicase SrmB [Pseudomonas tohonis]|uniref:ATP-dependent RNA helicase SrmB n=1 Tax=Pseudomonas tohonis TaxID=2725477 RepID=A0A6J4E1Z5_9PSED|nr:ATP-dependent RNA helicase SrmB [Pseudomonas tohonis]GJN51409.1 ATP-dependent RNA helicase SrmB [Pseudomonas tohonis]